MNRTLIIGRREFTLEALVAALSSVAITISGCGGGDGSSTPVSPTPSPAPSPGGGVGGTVSENHGHSAVITGAQITAANALQLDIRGTADHAHTVTLSAAAVESIRTGRPVVTSSTSAASTTTSSHVHTVTFNGDAPGTPIEY